MLSLINKTIDAAKVVRNVLDLVPEDVGSDVRMDFVDFAAIERVQITKL